MRASGSAPRIAAAAALAALAAAPAVATGQGRPPKPPRDQPALTLDARPTTIVFGTASTLTGRLSGTSRDRGVRVVLEADDTAPFGDSYRNTGMVTTTTPSGDYTFTVNPALNTQYRTVAQASPPVTSGPRLVLVRMSVSLRLSDSTPRRGTRVRFFGSVRPAHDGRIVQIQRRTSTGRWRTVARATLRDAGDLRSRYSRRVRVRRDGVYRVKAPGDGDHVNGYSRTRAIDVHG